MYRTGIKRRAISSVAREASAMRQAIARGSLRATFRNPRSTRIVSSRALRAATQEKKGMDTILDIASVISSTNTNANSFVMNLIQQGTGSWNRIGRKVLLKSLRLKGWVIFNLVPAPATGQVSSNSVRMVVVWDKQPNSGTIPTFDAIFGITTQDGTEVTSDVLNPPKYDNMDRFRVIKDCVIDQPAVAFQGSGSAPELGTRVAFDEYIKLKNLEVNYSNTSNPSTIADISTGALYVFFRAANTSATASASIDGSGRLRYTD